MSAERSLQLAELNIQHYHEWLRNHPKKRKYTSDAQIRAAHGAGKPHLKRYTKATLPNGEPLYVWVCSLGGTWGRGITPQWAYAKYRRLKHVNDNAQREANDHE